MGDCEVEGPVGHAVSLPGWPMPRLWVDTGDHTVSAAEVSTGEELTVKDHVGWVRQV